MLEASVAKVENPTYLALSSDSKNLYSVSKTEGKGSVIVLEFLEDRGTRKN